jgi:hypothetical protein
MQGLRKRGHFSRRDWVVYGILAAVIAGAAVVVGVLLLP